jgi:hypothetical protein
MGDFDNKKKKREKKPSNLPRKCPNCSVEFCNADSLRGHLSSKSQKTNPCAERKASTNKKRESWKKRVKCPTCKGMFARGAIVKHCLAQHKLKVSINVADDTASASTLSKGPAQGFRKFSHNVGDGRSGGATKCYFYWKPGKTFTTTAKCPVCGSTKARRCEEAS